MHSHDMASSYAHELFCLHCLFVIRRRLSLQSCNDKI